MNYFNMYFRKKSNLQMYILKYFTTLYAIMLGCLKWESTLRNLTCIFHELQRIIRMTKPSKFLQYASAGI